MKNYGILWIGNYILFEFSLIMYKFTAVLSSTGHLDFLQLLDPSFCGHAHSFLLSNAASVIVFSYGKDMTTRNVQIVPSSVYIICTTVTSESLVVLHLHQPWHCQVVYHIFNMAVQYEKCNLMGMTRFFSYIYQSHLYLGFWSVLENVCL